MRRLPARKQVTLVLGTILMCIGISVFFIQWDRRIEGRTKPEEWLVIGDETARGPVGSAIASALVERYCAALWMSWDGATAREIVTRNPSLDSTYGVVFMLASKNRAEDQVALRQWAEGQGVQVWFVAAGGSDVDVAAARKAFDKRFIDARHFPVPGEAVARVLVPERPFTPLD
jgi:hypothetical protein